MIGNTVANYKIIDKIGEGGMGAVFLGVDTMLEREVAIKMLRPELARQPNIVERFRTEAVTLAKLNHPNIATLYNFLRQGDDFFMVMEFVRGETLDSLIRRVGAIGCERAVQLFCLALEGIDHAHKLGIVHRDIKPANIMLTNAGSIKVMDFGIARVLGSSRMTKTGHLIGTVEYMSPEQVRGEETDARADIYSLGILLYEMLTGRAPFTSTSEYELMRSHVETAPPPPRNLAPNIPLPIEQAIMRSLAKMPQMRYQTAGEFRRVLLDNIGSSAKAMDQSSGVYAAPATRLDEPRMSEPRMSEPRMSEPRMSAGPSGGAIKETRLPSQAEVLAAARVGEIKETRLAQGNEAAMRFEQGAQPATAALPQSPKTSGSLFGSLNWKHYAGAAAALAAIIILPLVLLGGGDKQPATEPATSRPPATAQPSAAQPPAAAAPAVEQTVAPVPSQPGFQPPPASDLNQPENRGGGSASGNTRSPRPRNTVGTRAEQPPPSSTAAQQKPDTSTREDRAATSDESDKTKVKREGKLEKVVDAAGAVGGAAKKLGGLFKKKKND
jgi:serine/threonine protein kinase